MTKNMALGFAVMFCNFHSVKNHKTANNLATTEAIEKNKHRFGILVIFEKKLIYIRLNVKIMNFDLIKLGTNFK
jgi:hypothetical protein